MITSTFEEKIGGALDSILNEEGLGTFEEADRFDRLKILEMFEDKYDINIDISDFDKVQTRKDIIQQVTLSLLQAKLGEM